VLVQTLEKQIGVDIFFWMIYLLGLDPLFHSFVSHSLLHPFVSISLTFSHTSSLYYLFIDFLFEEEKETIQGLGSSPSPICLNYSFVFLFFLRDEFFNLTSSLV
jgi:hypothetical protein